jgi:hypothetical protein
MAWICFIGLCFFFPKKITGAKKVMGCTITTEAGSLNRYIRLFFFFFKTRSLNEISYLGVQKTWKG